MDLARTRWLKVALVAFVVSIVLPLAAGCTPKKAGVNENTPPPMKSKILEGTMQKGPTDSGEAAKAPEGDSKGAK